MRWQDDKEQRKERGAAYYRTVVLLNRLDRFAGSPPDQDTLSTTIDEYTRRRFTATIASGRVS